MIIGSKNKGDWSEFYVLLKLLGERKLHTADEDLNIDENFWLPINSIIRNDTSETHIDFILHGEDNVTIYVNNEPREEYSSQYFRIKAAELYSAILVGSGSFDIPEFEELLNDLYLERLAAPSSNITDITMTLHDTNTGIDQMMGFSIKSYIGGSPTLLNASGATNFVYEVVGLNDQQMDEINSINSSRKIKERIKAIYDNGGLLQFSHSANDMFSSNLAMVDSRLEELLAEFVEISYKENELNCKNIIEQLEAENPLGYPRRGLYEYKFKQFLCAKALGLEPSVEWSGEDDANGGYIVAKSDGEVVAYHLYNRDKFKKYLYENTKIERASTTRHGYATLYKNDEKMYINLNLQIRFK